MKSKSLLPEDDPVKGIFYVMRNCFGSSVETGPFVPLQ